MKGVNIMKLSEDQKFAILKEAYLETRKEAVFWRERSWKVTTWIIGLFLAISGGSIFAEAKHPILILPMIALSAVATIYLHKNYMRYAGRMQIAAQIEKALAFFEKGEYIPDETLLDADKSGPPVTYLGTAFFMASIWIVALSTAAALLCK